MSAAIAAWIRGEPLVVGRVVLSASPSAVAPKAEPVRLLARIAALERALREVGIDPSTVKDYPA